MEPFFLAKLIGAYLIIYGIVIALRRKSIISAVTDIGKSRGLLFMLSTIELAAGLAIVIQYPSIMLNWVGVISLIGWLMILESVVYLASPLKFVRKIFHDFDSPQFFVAGGIFSVLLGLYLFAAGIGVF